MSCLPTLAQTPQITRSLEMIDTILYTRKLEEAGLTREQAELMVRTQFEMISHNVATKHDIVRLEHQIESLENRLDSKFTRMISELNQKFTERNNELDQKFTRMYNELDQKFTGMFSELDRKLDSMETRLILKLGTLIVVAIGALKLFT
jgi:DNA anti-recombination protein RmuC